MKSGELRVESGEWRVESEEWRVEMNFATSIASLLREGGRLSSQVQHFLERTSIGEKKSSVLRGRLLIKATTAWSSSSVTL